MALSNYFLALKTDPIMNIQTITRKIVFALLVTVSVTAGSSVASAQGWYNPEIYNSGRQISGAYYDPFTGKIVVRTDKETVRESVLDPNRSYVDPGSYRQVNRYETDVNGIRWHVTGTQWTSNGVPHGNLSRRRVGGVNIGGGVVEDRNEKVIYSTQGTGSNQRQPAPRGQVRPGVPSVGVPSVGVPRTGGFPSQGGVIEDRNETVRFGTISPSPRSTIRSGSSRSNNLRSNLRSFGRNLNPFK